MKGGGRGYLLPQILFWMQDQAATNQQSHCSIFAACNTLTRMTEAVATMLAGNMHLPVGPMETCVCSEHGIAAAGCVQQKQHYMYCCQQQYHS